MGREKPVHLLSEHSLAPRRQWDRDFPAAGPEKTARIDLGLALLSLVAKEGVPLAGEDIAAWCGCTDSAIYQIEQRALKKLRNALQFRRRNELAELRDSFFHRREPARRAA